MEAAFHGEHTTKWQVWVEKLGGYPLTNVQIVL